LQICNVGVGPLAPILALNTLDMTTGIEHAHGVEVQSLHLGNRKYDFARRFWDVSGNRVFQSDDGHSLACGKRGQQLVQLAAGCGRAVEDLVGGVIFYLCVTGAAGPLLLLHVRVKVPNTIYQRRDAPRTT
jgi:hypothetical protein